MDTTPTNVGKKVITLFSGTDATVTVVPEDRDTFCMSVAEAIEACKFASTGYSLLMNISDLRDELHLWLKERHSQIGAAYLSFRDSGLLFVVVQSDVPRDRKLADELTELDLQLASDTRFESLNIDVLSVPKSSTSSILAFTSSGRVNTYAGNQ